MNKILVLEDSEDDLFFFQCAVEKITMDISDVEFVYREDGEAGLDWLASNTPTLIITDNEMNPMDGIMFIEALHNSQSLQSIPIAMMSGRPSHPTIDKVRHIIVALHDKNDQKGMSSFIETLLRNYVFSVK